MDWIRVLLSRCAALFRRKKLDADLDAELRAHIELAIADNQRNGMPAEEARIAALRSFGGVTQIRETYRVQRGLPWFEQIARDIRFAVRQLRKSSRLRAHGNSYISPGHRCGNIGLQRRQCGFAQTVRLSRPGSARGYARDGK